VVYPVGGGILILSHFYLHQRTFNCIIIGAIDAIDIDDEYIECYYLNASLYLLMSKLMFE